MQILFFSVCISVSLQFKKTLQVYTIVFYTTTLCVCECVCTNIVGHHDGEQGLVVRIKSDIQGRGLDHDEDSMKDWGNDNQENNIRINLNQTIWSLNSVTLKMN